MNFLFVADADEYHGKIIGAQQVFYFAVEIVDDSLIIKALVIFSKILKQ